MTLKLQGKVWKEAPKPGSCEEKLATLDWTSPDTTLSVDRSSCASLAKAGAADDDKAQQSCVDDLLAIGDCIGERVSIDRNSLLGNQQQFLQYPGNKATVDGGKLSLTVDFQVLAQMWTLGRIRDDGHSNLWAVSSAEDFAKVWTKFLPKSCEDKLKVMKYQIDPRKQGICSAESLGRFVSEQCSLECSRFVSALTVGCQANTDALKKLSEPCAGMRGIGTKFDEGITIRFLASFGWLSFLTLLAVLLRNNVAFLRSFGIPTSLIGGCLAFGLCQLAPLVLSGNGTDWFKRYLNGSWENLAPLAINIVFATVFVGVSMPAVKVIAKEGGGMLFFGLTAVFASYAISFALAAIMGQASNVAGIAIPVGFAGGHGTAAAVTDALTQAGWAEGKDWCVASATISLLVAVFGGTALVNLGKSKGWLPKESADGAVARKVPKDLLELDDRTRPMKATIRETSLDSYAWHLVLTGNVCALGYLIQRLLVLAHPVFGELPAFAMCLIASLLTQLFLQSVDKTDLVDRATLGSIANVALYYIVFSGVATMDLEGLAKGAGPLLILCAVNIVFYLSLVIFLAPLVFPDFWYERAIFEWGAGVGTTPIGLLCVSMADPNGERDEVRRAIGYKLMLHEPIINGYLTFCLSAAQWDNGAWTVAGISAGLSCACLAALVMIGRGGKQYESL